MHRRLRDVSALVLAGLQPVLFVVLFRGALDGAAWSGVALVAQASTYLAVRLAGSPAGETPDRHLSKRRPSA